MAEQLSKVSPYLKKIVGGKWREGATGDFFSVAYVQYHCSLLLAFTAALREGTCHAPGRGWTSQITYG